MATCVGCGAQLDATWKYCIHCGIATDAREITNDVRPVAVVEAPPARLSSGALITAGAIIFVVGVTVLVVLLLAASGKLHG
jgi:hypothetical protein